jgi:hypothetical protein
MKLPTGDKLAGDQDDIAAIVPAPAPGILQVRYTINIRLLTYLSP